MIDNLSDRITEAIWDALDAQRFVGWGPYVDRANGVIDTSGSEGIDMAAVADAVIRELGPIPDREFTDQWGHHWEWCGGVIGTWAWRITRLEQR